MSNARGWLLKAIVAIEDWARKRYGSGEAIHTAGALSRVLFGYRSRFADPHDQA